MSLVKHSKLLLLVILAAASVDGASICDGNQYFIPNIRSNWFKAVEFCHSIDMRLVSIQSREENEAIAKYVKKTDKFNDIHCEFWIGGSDLSEEGTFTWIESGNVVTYSNWSMDEPNNANENEDCMQLVYIPRFGQRWTWNDNNCMNRSYYFICESVPQNCIQEFK